jgi:hypothetical protein
MLKLLKMKMFIKIFVMFIILLSKPSLTGTILNFSNTSTLPIPLANNNGIIPNYTLLNYLRTFSLDFWVKFPCNFSTLNQRSLVFISNGTNGFTIQTSYKTIQFDIIQGSLSKFTDNSNNVLFNNDWAYFSISYNVDLYRYDQCDSTTNNNSDPFKCEVGKISTAIAPATTLPLLDLSNNDLAFLLDNSNYGLQLCRL